MRKSAGITLPKGKLGVLTAGMGAVAITFMAGVDLVRQEEVAAYRLPDATGNHPGSGSGPKRAPRRSRRFRAAGNA